MKFRLTEDILNEATLYRLDLKSSEKGLSDYLYIIGNNDHNFRTVDDVKDFLDKQADNKESVNPYYEYMLQDFNSLKVRAIDLSDAAGYKEYLKLLHNKPNKLLNTTHRSDRGKYFMGNDYMIHHLDGVEQNQDVYNLMGIKIDKAGHEKLVHNIIHFTNFSKRTKCGSAIYDVKLYDGKNYTNHQLEITARII